MQKLTNPQLGQVVFSKQGRDSGQMYFITKIESAEFVFVSNGTSRPIDKPKKKRLKHLNLTQQISNALNEKLRLNQKVDNSELVNAINIFKKLQLKG